MVRPSKADNEGKPLEVYHMFKLSQTDDFHWKEAIIVMINTKNKVKITTLLTITLWRMTYLNCTKSHLVMQGK